MKFRTEDIYLVLSSFSSSRSTLSLSLGVHVIFGGSLEQGAAAEQLKLTEVPSNTSTFSVVKLGLGGESV